MAGLVAAGRPTSLVGAVLALAACGVLPSLPPAVPTSVVPSTVPVPSVSATSVLLSADGFDSVRRMAVRVRNIGCGELSTGSGFALDSHTLITNRHVVQDAATLQISTYDGHDVTATTVATAQLADLALVRTQEALPSTAGLADADPKIGDPISVVGYPLGRELTIADGHVIARATDPLHVTLGGVLVTDAQVEPGSSGSAALDSAGRVIGVVYAKSSDERSYLVPVSTLRTMLNGSGTFTPAPSCSG